jgi:hypothetical protein
VPVMANAAPARRPRKRMFGTVEDHPHLPAQYTVDPHRVGSHRERHGEQRGYRTVPRRV